MRPLYADTDATGRTDVHEDRHTAVHLYTVCLYKRISYLIFSRKIMKDRLKYSCRVPFNFPQGTIIWSPPPPIALRKSGSPPPSAGCNHSRPLRTAACSLTPLTSGAVKVPLLSAVECAGAGGGVGFHFFLDAKSSALHHYRNQYFGIEFQQSASIAPRNRHVAWNAKIDCYIASGQSRVRTSEETFRKLGFFNVSALIFSLHDKMTTTPCVAA